MFEQTKALCRYFRQLGIPGVDLIVYKDGQCILRYMDGYADPDKQIPVQGKEKYHIFSCSKLITCAAAMQLWEKGMFSLEDNLSDYLPAFGQMTVQTETGIQPAKNQIKIRDLFQMTAGLNYNIWTPALLAYYEACERRCPTVEMVNEIAKTPLDFEPGQSWKYSLCHDVLAALVEVLSGEKFENYVKTHIFDPLGMAHSDFLHPMEDWEGFARMFLWDNETGKIRPWTENPYRPGTEYASGGAGCVSTVEDYIKFLEALRVGDKILKKQTIAMMATNHLTEQQLQAYSNYTKGMGYGLGMRTPLHNPDRSDFGWGGAAGAFAAVDPVNNITIFYAQHVLQSPIQPLRGWLYYAVRADLEGKTVEIPCLDPNYDPSITY